MILRARFDKWFILYGFQLQSTYFSTYSYHTKLIGCSGCWRVMYNSLFSQTDSNRRQKLLCILRSCHKYIPYYLQTCSCSAYLRYFVKLNSSIQTWIINGSLMEHFSRKISRKFFSFFYLLRDWPVPARQSNDLDIIQFSRQFLDRMLDVKS